MTKKKLLGMMVITLVMAIIAFSGSAFAAFIAADTGAQDEIGNVIIFPYYDIRTTAQGGPGLSDNYFTVINTNDTNWINAHVRVRTGQCSVELLDFDVILSPNDVFAFDLYQTETGTTQFASCDTHTLTASNFDVDPQGCFVLDTGTFPNQLALIEVCGNCPDGSGAPLSEADALAATRWGYVEVIGELAMIPDTTAGATRCTEAQLAAGDYTSWSWATDPAIGTACCNSAPASCATPDPDLAGRIYYAQWDASDPRNLVELASSNGLSMHINAICGDGLLPVAGVCNGRIIHRPCLSDSSAGCSAGDGELENANPFVNVGSKYAYTAASIAAPTQAATDLNQCFYRHRITADNDVTNRVGAGCTFGPTLADVQPGGPRNGNQATVVGIILNQNNASDKTEAVSHYFYLPGMGQTRYVFTFPYQHFLGQRIEISTEARYDNEEGTCAITTGKFLSPGITLPGVPSGEVSIIATQATSSSCTFNEGWLDFTLAVTDDGRSTADAYIPGVLGTVVNFGDGSAASVMTTAPMQFK